MAAGDFEGALRLTGEARALGRELGQHRRRDVRARHRGRRARGPRRCRRRACAALDEAAAAALGGEFDDLRAAGWTCCLLIGACERVRDYDRAAQWCAEAEAFGRKLDIRFVNGHLPRPLRRRPVLARRLGGGRARADRRAAGAHRDAPWLAPARGRPARRAAAAPGAPGRGARAVRARRSTTRWPGSAAPRRRSTAATPRRRATRRSGSCAPSARRRRWRGPARWSCWCGRGARPGPKDPPPAQPRRTVPPGPPAQPAQPAQPLRMAPRGPPRRPPTPPSCAPSPTRLRTRPLVAAAGYCEGLAAAAAGDHEAALARHEEAVEGYAAAAAPLETARARLGAAEALAALGRSDAARREAAAAVEALEAIGAEAECRRARAVARRLGGASRGELSAREVEVLRLVAEGLSDRQIAGRADAERAHRAPSRLEHPHEAPLLLARGGGGAGAPPRPALSGRFRPSARCAQDGRWRGRRRRQDRRASRP